MNHRPRKRFGQNFLHDRQVIDRIVRAIAPDPAVTLVEIGPGRGALTRPLLRRTERLHVVELDRDLVDDLNRLAADHPGLTVHAADALRFDFGALAAAHGPLQVVGNLPYNISTPLLFHLLEYRDSIREMVFMLQAEVVDRLAARTGSGDYGRLSVIVQLYCEVERLFGVPPDAFTPRPKVDSAIVRLRPRPQALADTGDPARFADLVKLAFGQRRKTMRNALRVSVDAETLRAVGIDPTARAETVEIEQFAALSRYLQKPS